MILQSMTT